MLKYLTIYTLTVIVAANAAILAFRNLCIETYNEFGASLPVPTAYAWAVINNNHYLLFSVMTMILVVALPFSMAKEKSSAIQQVILGLHLLILSAFIFSFLLPFMSPCETIQ